MFLSPPPAPAVISEQASNWQPYSIESFVGGLNSAEPASAIRQDQQTTLSNLYHTPSRRLVTRGPYRPWLVASEDTILPNTAPPSTFTIIELRGTDFRVAAWDAGANFEVSVYDESNNRWAGEGGGTTIKGNLTDGFKVRFAKFSVNEAEDMLFCNGKDTPQRWVGTVDTASTDLGLTAPTITNLLIANTATANKEGITLNGTYHYKFTAFYDDSGTSTKFGESGPSASDSVVVAGAVVSTDTTVSAALTQCPAIPAGATHNFVYRSPPDNSLGIYRQVGKYTAGTAFTDQVPTDSLGVAAPLDAGTPPKLKNFVVHGGRVWGIGLSAAGALSNKGVWSQTGNPDYYAAFDFAYFPDPLTGPMPFQRDMYWFTEKQIYITPNADPVANPEPIKICDIGCDSFDSIVDVGNGLCWQYEGNIYWANFNSFNPKTGDLPWPIGEPIRDRIADIPTAQRANTTAELHKERAYFSFSGTNQTANTSTLVWDVKHGSAMLAQGLAGAWISLDWAANDLKSWDGTLYSADNTNKYIMEHDFAGTADFLNKTDFDASTSQNIPIQLATGNLFLGHEAAEKIVNSLSLLVKSSGITIVASFSFDGGSFERSKTFVLGTGSVSANSTWLVWGQGTWGNFNWASSAVAAQNAHKKIPKGGKSPSVQLTLNSSNAQDTELILAKIYHKILPIPS